MVRPTLRRTAALAGLALLVALAGTPPVLAAAAQPAAAAGVDLTGTACRSGPRSDIAADPDAPAPLYLYCGATARPSGAVAAVLAPLSLPQDAAARHALLEHTAATTPAGRATAQRMACAPGRWQQTPDELELFIRPCALADGNWPAIQVIARLGRLLLLSDGLPATLPVLETAMARLADYRPAQPAFGGTAAAPGLLEAALGGKPPLVGSADFVRFSGLMKSARLHDSQRNYGASEEAYRQALALQERAFGTGAAGVGSTLIDLALEVSNQQRFDEAAALMRRADPIIQRSPDKADRARFFTYMAFEAANAGEDADALRYAADASATWRQLGTADAAGVAGLGRNDAAGTAAVRGELAHSLNVQAAMALRQGDLAGAELAAKEALGIVAANPDLPPWWRPEVLTTLGEIYAREGRFAEAERSYRGALVFQQRLFGNTAPMAVTLLSLGRVYTEERVYDAAIRADALALNILARDAVARADVTFDLLAPLVTAANAEAAQHPERGPALDALVFRAVQLMGSSVADQTIERASIRLAAGDPAIGRLVRQLQDAERRRDEARLELAHEDSLPDAERGATAEAALLAEINHETAQRDTLDRQLEKQFPDYARLAQPGPVALDDLQRRLHGDEAVVLFDVGRHRSAVILAKADGFSARTLTLDRARLAAAVRRLRRAFVTARPGPFDLNEAYDLYRTLFAPIEAQLRGIHHLIIVPSGALASLPLGLLVTQRPARGGAADYRDAAWLAQRFALSTVPSVRSFVTLRSRGRGTKPSLPFLGIGDPAFQGSARRAGGVSTLAALAAGCREGGALPPQLLRGLAPLPETAGEVQAVARSLGATPDSVLLGRRATEAAFRAEPLDRFRVLYFATHGLLPNELDCQSEPALALSPPPQPTGSTATDGLLEASEIAALPLDADLVVLSACNTAEGTTGFGGEALAGLAEAFFYAGARTVVASHWQVPSAATTALMTTMFGRLGPQLSGGTAEALRQAQLQLIRRDATAHPFYWAAFTVIGDGAAATTAAVQRPGAARGE